MPTMRCVTDMRVIRDRQGSHLSDDKKCHLFFRLLPGKRNEIPGQFALNTRVGVDNLDITQM